MSNSIERYKKLGLTESVARIYRYPIVCQELSFILRGAYNKVPKNLQSLIFQDTLTAFRLLPRMQTSSAVSAAHLLLKSAEAVLPKQKRNLAVTEFKQAKVAQKRRHKARQEEIGSAQLPLDVLVHIFSFLDMRSLVSVGLVCWSWNLAASDDHLWHSQYSTFFSDFNDCSKIKVLHLDRPIEEEDTQLQEDMLTQSGVAWREAFKRTYRGCSSKKLSLDRGYCGHCDAIVWLSYLKCSNKHYKLKSETQQIKPMTPRQVVEYVLDDSLSVISSSDSDSESDERSISRLWAYPRHVSRFEKPSWS